MKYTLTILALLLGSDVFGAINVYRSTSAPSALESQFLADVTTQYLVTVKPGLFGSVTVTLLGKNPLYTPPAISTTILTLDSITQRLVQISSDNFVYGYADGMDNERAENLELISGLQAADIQNGLVGAQPIFGSQPFTVVNSTNPLSTVDMVLMSTTTAAYNAWRIYNHVGFFIRQRSMQP